MSAVDERVVEMKFKNSGFLEGIRSTLKALGDLKAKLDFGNAKKGLDELSSAGRRFNLGSMGTTLEGINTKFAAMATVAITALSRITSAAIDTGTRMVSALTIDPVKQGLQEYETNLNSIQTILANTEASGATLGDVNAALKELNEYSDQTIYNFSEMARNIGTFTAAGVALEPATASIKGIANLAALSGSNSQQASTAMYQLSQAIAAGRVSLMDWNSVVNAGMGGSVFQRALAQTAVAMGTLDEKSVSLSGAMKNVTIDGQAFRESISAANGGESWLTSDVLTTTLSQFTGDLTDAELAAQGFNEAQIQAIQQTAKTARAAATEVKTATQLFGTLQESAGSGWAQTFELIIGDFEEAKALFTAVNNTLGAMIGASADARNQMIGEWKELGGRTDLIAAIATSFSLLQQVIAPIKEAFRDIFPAVTGKQLADLTARLLAFIEGIEIAPDILENLKRTARGVFAAFDIGIMVIQGVASVIGRLLGVVFEGTGGFLEFTGGVGDFVVSLRDALRNGEGLTGFFERLGDILVKPIEFIQRIGAAIRELFTGADFGSVGDIFQERFGPLEIIGNTISKLFSGLGAIFARVWTLFKPMASAIGEFFSGIGSTIANAFGDVDYSSVLDTINTGLLAGLVLSIQKFLGGGGLIDQIKGLFSKDDDSPGLFDSIKESFGALTETLTNMQAQIKSKTILQIAAAVGILTASVVALSLIDSGDLTKSLVAIGAMFTMLGAAQAIIGTLGGFVRMPFIAAGLVTLAAAILILSGAVRSLSGLSWEELAKGLSGVAVLLGAVAIAGNILSKNSGGLISAGIGITAISVAINILAAAVRNFSELSWEEMARGLVGVAGALTALGIFGKFAAANKAGIANGAGLILLGVALKVISGVVGDFADMSWGEIAKGLIAMGGALLVVAGAMALMSGTLLGAASTLVVAAALAVIQPVLQSFGEMSWGEIGKAATVLAGALLLIAGGMYLMTAALPGAAALIVVAAALQILAPVLTTLGAMSWEEIGKGLVALAGAFAVLGVAGLVLTPLVPVLFGMGAAIALIGAGVFLAGAGILAIAVAISALAVAGTAGTVALTAMLAAIIGLIPALAEQMATALVTFLQVLANATPTLIATGVTMFRGFLEAVRQVVPDIVQTVTLLALAMLKAVEALIPKYVETGTKIFKALLDAAEDLTPDILDTVETLVTSMLDHIVDMVPSFVDAALDLISGILDGVAQGIPDVASSGADVAIAFMDAIANEGPRIADAGADMVIDLVNGVANSIRSHQGEMNSAGRNLAGAIIDGMTGGLASRVGSVARQAASVARSALSSAKAALGIKSPSREFRKVGVYSAEGLVVGLRDSRKRVQAESIATARAALNAMRSNLDKSINVYSAKPPDIKPSIKPVLDQQALKAAREMALKRFAENRRQASWSLDVGSSLTGRGAGAIAIDREAGQAARDAFADRLAYVNGKGVVFNQYNTSPKSLPEAEIYRKTSSQLATARKRLKKL